eukprot:6209821-Pleurochrysis_carterae.AAC.4
MQRIHISTPDCGSNFSFPSPNISANLSRTTSFFCHVLRPSQNMLVRPGKRKEINTKEQRARRSTKRSQQKQMSLAVRTKREKATRDVKSRGRKEEVIKCENWKSSIDESG